MNGTRRTKPNGLALAILFGAVILTALILPRAASAWYLNQANANLARACARSSDPTARAALTQAEAQLTQARTLSDDPRIALAQARLWLAHNQASRAADALRAADSALRDDLIAQFIWGNAEWQAGNALAAFEHWRAAGAFEYFINQAYRSADKHAWQAAADNARIAAGIEPASAAAHYTLGDALVWQNAGDPEALRELARAQELTRDPELLSTILSRQGEALVKQGKEQAALDYFERAQNSAPLDARPRTGYAKLLLRLEPSAEARAIAILTQVVTDSPWYLDAYVTLANIAEAHNDLSAAERWYRAGLTKNANNPDLLFLLGEFYARHYRAAEARQTLALALKFEPHADDAQRIQRALQELGER